MSKPSPVTPNYCSQESPQTLAEGLDEYYRVNAGVATRPADLPPESAQLFRSHDACHVIFGLTTSPADEAVTDTRAMFSSTVGAKGYAAYLASDRQAKAIFAEFGFWRLIGTTLLALPRIGRAVFEAVRIKNRWPWIPPQSYYAQSLGDLRRRHGIRVI